MSDPIFGWFFFGYIAGVSVTSLPEKWPFWKRCLVGVPVYCALAFLADAIMYWRLS
jgi:hypothetical protein